MSTYRVKTIVMLMLFGFGVNGSIAQSQSAAYDSAPEPHIQAAAPDTSISMAPTAPPEGTPAPSSTHMRSSGYWDGFVAPEKMPATSSHVRLSGYWNWQDHHWVWKPDPKYVK